MPRPQRFSDNLRKVLRYLPPGQVEALVDELRGHLPSQFNLEKAVQALKPNSGTLTRETLDEIKGQASQEGDGASHGRGKR